MLNIDDHFIVHPHDGESPLEVRAISKADAKPKLFYPKDYSNSKEMQEAFYGYAMHLNQQGYNCYTLMNPIRADFRASPGKGTTKDGVAHRTKVMVDLDRKCNEAKKHPATSDELTRAEDLINKISDYAVEIGWGRPHKVMSGNGYHLYFTLAGLENDDESELLIKETLETLAEKFDTEEFEIDTVVFDANRITKIIGTVARKGEETPDRPYRTVELIK
jgi:hypothetical protein